MTTISTNATVSIDLLSPSYTNPIVVDPGVTINGTHLGLFAPAGSWTILNHGSVGGAATYTVGVYVQAGAGVVVNDGTIAGGSGAGAGVILALGGLVANAASGLITGGDGIEIGGIQGHLGVPDAGPGTVVNYGRIEGSSPGANGGGSYGLGVYLGAGGFVTNAAGGLITGGFGNENPALSGGAAVEIQRGSGTVINSGTIAGISTEGSGIVLSGLVLNTASATISGGTGVNLSVGTVFNSGTIMGQGAYGQGVVLMQQGSVVNAASGSITGTGSGIHIVAGFGAVSNYGVIAGSLAAGVNLGSIGDTLTNAAWGTITGADGVDGFSDTVINAGRISGTGADGRGVYLTGGGWVTNAASGSITGVGAGVGIQGAGTVLNSGRIEAVGTSGQGVVLFGGSVTNAAQASIIGGYAGVAGRLAPVTVVNRGTIVSTGDYGAGAVYLGGGGLVINQAGGTIGLPSSQPSAVYLNGSGTVVNAGLMNAGVWLKAGGAVTNQSGGTIVSVSTSGGYGVGFHAGGLLTNAGLISGLLTGVDAGHLGAMVTNQAGGTIAGGYVGVLMGLVDQPAAGVRAVDNQAGGTITGDIGILVGASSGTVTNAGVISGTLAGTITKGPVTLGVGAGVTSSSGGVVTNLSGGTIAGATYGVAISGGAGTVVNGGTITGSGGTAVALAAGYANLVVIDQGARFNGTVSGGNAIGSTAVSTLELASSASFGTLSSLGTQFVDFGSILFDRGARWLVAGDTAALAGTIHGLGSGGTIELTGVTATGSSFTGGVLTLTEATGAATIDLAGNLAISEIVVTNVSGGVDISVQPRTLVWNGGGASGAFASASNWDDITNGLNPASVAPTSADTVEFLSGGGTVTGPGAAASLLFAGSQPWVISSITGAVTLGAGASLTAASGGLVENLYGTAIYSSGAAVSVTNAGTIAGSGANGVGVDLLAGGFVSNAAGGTIQGAIRGVYFANGAGSLVNAGSIGSPSALHSTVVLLDGGFVSNAVTGTISASGIKTAVYGNGAPVTIVNAGLLSSQLSKGVGLNAGGAVTNLSTGTISGASGVGITGRGSVFNAGSIIGSTGNGIALASGGSVTNQTSGVIYGYGDGVSGASLVVNAGTISAHRFPGIYFKGSRATVVNSGVVQSSLVAALVFETGGLVVNQAGGTISGPNGIFIGAAAGTVVNNGAITAHITDVAVGGSGTPTNAGSISAIYAVQFAGGFANRLIVDPGAAFTGQVSGGNPTGGFAVSTMEMASAATAGTLSGLGIQFVNFAQTTIDAGAAWTLTGANTVMAGATLTNFGTLTELNGTLSGGGVIINDGTIIADPSTLTFTSLTGTGVIDIATGSTVITTGTVGAGETIAFSGANGELDLNYASFSGVISGFTPSDRIVLPGVTDGTTAQVVNGNTLQIVQAGNATIDLTLDPNQTYTGESFGISPDGSVTQNLGPICFLPGTLIRTPDGEVPVERLAPGDMVLTASGEVRPIVWVGTGQVLAARGRRSAATPVIVRKGALADNVPHRDLRVTKAHALHIDEVLIPVEFLVNHRTILWDDHAQEVTIFHIELPAHDVLLANGAPAESYRDDGNRWLFRNANAGWGLPPQPPCAPVVTGGAVLDGIWGRLLERAGPRPSVPLTEDADVHLVVDGWRLDAVERTDDVLVFRLPDVPSSLRIVSRAAAPAELGLARDPRVLGVALRRLAVRRGSAFRAVRLNDTRLGQGFHAFEAERGVRWTDGDAVIPAQVIAGFAAPFEVVLQVGGRTRYLADGGMPRVA